MGKLISSRDEGRQKSSTALGDQLTPAARRELAGRALVVALEQFVDVVLRDRGDVDEWVDQHTSPLGKRAHLEAVRAGMLPGVKHGRRVLVRRAELNSFLENHSVKDHAVRNGSRGAVDSARVNEIAAEVLAQAGLRLRKG